MARRVAGIDVGGTFTDVLLFEDDGVGGQIRFAKVPSTTGNQAEGVLQGLEATGTSPAITRPRSSDLCTVRVMITCWPG